MKKPSRRLPAEWERHAATLLAFPYEGRDWPGKYAAVVWAFAEIIKKVAAHEPALLVVKTGEQQAKVADILSRAHVDLEQVRFFIKDTNRSWMRDSGPIIVKRPDGTREALQFRFNGWAKYGNHRKDQGIPSAVADGLGLPLTQVLYNEKPVVLEGGAIDGNGCGALVTTEECLLDSRVQVRNPGFTKGDYEAVFREYLGVTQVIWLGKGIAGDDTHGHVDDICRFVNGHTVVACRETNRKDKNSKHLAENLERLQGVRLGNGAALNVVTIPLPDRLDFEDLRLPASYVNFIFVKGAVLVPTFNDPRDYEALGIFSELFPDRKVIGISAIDLIWGLGTLHCLSREIPAGKQ
ncbi:MAG: agmatine deiminase family protein [Deltaproteobacteria bacterium]|nr:agmatine deiminase family protein [Deltaproteobacteria bacterium]